MTDTPCDTCAFGQSGGAADEADNHLTGIICAFGAHPFYCHHGRDGQEYDRDNPLGPFQLDRNNIKLCAGWKAKVAELKRRGFFPDADRTYIRRFVAKRALTLLKTFLDRKSGPDKKKSARIELERCVRFIVKRRNDNDEIPL